MEMEILLMNPIIDYADWFVHQFKFEGLDPDCYKFHEKLDNWLFNTKCVYSLKIYNNYNKIDIWLRIKDKKVNTMFILKYGEYL